MSGRKGFRTGVRSLWKMWLKTGTELEAMSRKMKELAGPQIRVEESHQ